MKTNPHDAAMDDLDIRRERRFSGASRIILLSTLLFAVLGIWAYFGKLDEVSTGSGKVIPSSREQSCSRWMAVFSPSSRYARR